MSESGKCKEVENALVKLGYAYGFVARFRLEELDEDRSRVICDGHTIGIYDFVKHTFVD